jgi:crotonobetainyl-CoA:carnitine CoA-transferase CaiB-like acyl-CoA transferase
MDEMELGYSALDSIKKGIVLISITPFGQTGPYKDFQTTDIVTMGMSGILYQTGDFDRPPVHMNVPQACLHASADGAVGALLAYYHREMTGEGQHIDTAMQHSTAWFLANAVPFWELNNVVMKRAGSFRWANKSYQRQVWECKDGYVFFFMLGGKQGARTFHELVNWMDSEGMANDYLRSMDWETLDVFNASQEMIDKISEPIQAFFMSHTKKEISQGAGERQISMCPLSSMDDLLHSEQLEARNFWTEIDHPELNTQITYPREFVKSSEISCETRFRAPLIGEHNEEVYKEIGLSRQDLVVLKQAGII